MQVAIRHKEIDSDLGFRSFQLAARWENAQKQWHDDECAWLRWPFSSSRRSLASRCIWLRAYSFGMRSRSQYAITMQHLAETYVGDPSESPRPSMCVTRTRTFPLCTLGHNWTRQGKYISLHLGKTWLAFGWKKGNCRRSWIASLSHWKETCCFLVIPTYHRNFIWGSKLSFSKQNSNKLRNFSWWHSY